MAGEIYGLIAKASQMIGAIGKNTRNQQQGFMYRGVDAVMNALSPVMTELGIFMCPEVLEQTREERVNAKGTTLLYSILKIKYTFYAPDGSNVSCTVIGEGMDTGDKASNKAMSVAFKYAAFQMFCIPTEEMVDPDAEVHEVMPKFTRPQETAKAEVTKVPAANPVFAYIESERSFMADRMGITKEEMKIKFGAMRKSLIEGGVVKNIPADKLTMEQAKELVEAIYANFFTDKKDAK